MSELFSVTLTDASFITIPAGGGLAADDALPWLIDVDVFEQAVSNTNWDTLTVHVSSLLNGWKESSGAQNDEINFDAVIAKGTWDIELLFTKNSNNGIFSVQLDSVEKGTIDAYNASQTFNNRDSVSGIVVAASAKYRLKLKMATKNASSSSYYGEIVHIQLRRTA